MKIIDGGITAPLGFAAAGKHIGLKKAKKDFSILFSHLPSVAAGVFTQNLIKAAPIVWSQAIVQKSSSVRAIVTNSGNANACTGEQGFKHTVETAQITAQQLGISAEEVLICSTGVIGVPLPVHTLVKGIPEVVKDLGSSRQHATDAAEAIMTTDTTVKEIAVEIDLGGKIVRIGGMAKGSGMIHPNMATMLAFLTTDAKIEKELLQTMLLESVETSYNMISVDRDTSTNDAVLILANGAVGGPDIIGNSSEYTLLKNGLDYVNKHLAKEIVRDGEGASKVIEVLVRNMDSIYNAGKIAKSVVSSNLVKTAIFGQDANWGRVVCAMGYAGVYFLLEKIELSFISKAGSIIVFENGIQSQFDEQLALEVLSEKEITIDINMNSGSNYSTAWGCDLTFEYVRINGQYRT